MSLLKIDLHTHVSRASELTRPAWDNQTFCTPEQMIEKYDRDGVEYGCILPMVNPESAHLLVTNEEAMSICAQYPARFRWFCNLDPRMDRNDGNSDFAFFLNFYKERGALGCGEVCATLPFDDPRFEALFRGCEETGMPVIFHIADKATGMYGIYDEQRLPGLEGALRKFPNLIFFGHSQCFWAEIDANLHPFERGGYPAGKVTPGRIVYLLREYENLMCDISAGSGLNALRRDADFGLAFMEEFQDRLFFGQDICTPAQNHAHSSWLDGQRDYGNLSREAYEKICRGNFKRVFGSR